MRKTLWTRLAIVAGAGGLLAACGDNILPGNGDRPDAAPIVDGGEPDAEIDGAVADTYSGTITVLEASVLGVPQAGQGLQVGATFWRDADTVPPVLDTAPGSPIGCKVYEYTPADVGYVDVGLDEGVVTVTVDNETPPPPDPAIPACAHIPTVGYLCPDATQSTGGTIQGVPDTGNPGSCLPGLLMLTDTDAPFTFALTDGRYVSFSGTGVALLPDGTNMPVVNKIADTTIVVGGHPAVTSTCVPVMTLDTNAVHLTLGGVGPQPVCGTGQGCPDPGMMTNNADLAVTLTAGGGNHIPTFTADFDPPAGPGDDANLDAASLPIFGNLPMTGEAFTIGCDDAVDCGDGTGDGVVLAIETTDGSVAGISPLSMPPIVTKRVYIRCAALAADSVSVPANVAAYLTAANSGATRIQSTFIRGELGGGGDGVTSEVLVVVGHAITTFKTVTECNNGVDDADDDTDVDLDDAGCSSPNDTSED